MEEYTTKYPNTRNGGIYPQTLNTEWQNIPRNSKTWNGRTYTQTLKDGMEEYTPKH